MKREDPMPPTTLNPRKDVQGDEFKDPNVQAAMARVAADDFLKAVFTSRLRRPIASIEKRLDRLERMARKVSR